MPRFDKIHVRYSYLFKWWVWDLLFVLSTFLFFSGFNSGMSLGLGGIALLGSVISMILRSRHKNHES
jgi:hypothetical protein